MKRLNYATLGCVFGAAALGALTGCVGYVEEPHHVYASPPPPVYVERQVVVQPQYVYYPRHQVYYASHTRQYVYRDGRTWVSQPTPPRVSVDVLYASPSVRLGFSDAPSHHHSSVVRQYPRNWKPPRSDYRPGRGPRGDGRRYDPGDRR